MSAKAEALHKKQLDEELVKAQLEASRQDALRALMTDKIATLQPVPLDVPSSRGSMDVDNEERGQEVLEDAIIDIGSSDVEDAPPQHLPSPPPNITPRSAASTDTEEDAHLPSLNNKCACSSDDDDKNQSSLLATGQPVAKDTTKTARNGRLPSKIKVRWLINTIVEFRYTDDVSLCTRLCSRLKRRRLQSSRNGRNVLPTHAISLGLSAPSPPVYKLR
jgi:hypothetical protein